MRFNLIPSFDKDKNNLKNKGWIHIDVLNPGRPVGLSHLDQKKITPREEEELEEPNLAGLIYLTPDIERDTGTSLFDMRNPHMRKDKNKNPIKKILENKKCTWFLPRVSKLDARKQWIIGSVAPKGEVIIDQGALEAINNGKSLLPAGVKKISGIFEKGDHILVKDQNDIECARGLTSFSSIEIEKIKGSHSSKIKNILGYSSREEIIHKDDLVKV